MEMKQEKKKIPWKSYLEGFSKYKYIALVVLIGLVLLLWPTSSQQTQQQVPKAQTNSNTVAIIAFLFQSFILFSSCFLFHFDDRNLVGAQPCQSGDRLDDRQPD